jgi:hypothetical protein
MWKAQEVQNDAIQWGVDVESSASSEEGWPGVPADAVWPHQIGADGCPSIEGGVLRAFSSDFPWLGKYCVLYLPGLYIYFGFPLARPK